MIVSLYYSGHDEIDGVPLPRLAEELKWRMQIRFIRCVNIETMRSWNYHSTGVSDIVRHGVEIETRALRLAGAILPAPDGISIIDWCAVPCVRDVFAF